MYGGFTGALPVRQLQYISGRRSRMRGAKTSNPTPCLTCWHSLSLLGQHRRLVIVHSQCNIPSDTVQPSHFSVSTVLSHCVLFTGVCACNCCLGGYIRSVFPRELLIPIISCFIASVKSRPVWQSNTTVSTPCADMRLTSATCHPTSAVICALVSRTSAIGFSQHQKDKDVTVAHSMWDF